MQFYKYLYLLQLYNRLNHLQIITIKHAYMTFHKSLQCDLITSKLVFLKNDPNFFWQAYLQHWNFFYLVSMFRTTPSRCFLLYLRGFLKKVESPGWAHFYCCFIGEYHILEVFFVFNSFQTPLQSLLLVKCRIRN